MRIAHVTDCYLPGVGGIETQVHDLVVRQSARGHRVSVITSTPSPVAGEDPAGLIVHRPPWRNDRIGTVRYGHTPAGVSRITAGEFDVVHVHLSVLSPLALGALRRCARRGIPVVATVHSIWNRSTGVLAAGLGRTAEPNGTVAWSAVSTIAADAVARQLGVDVRVVPNGIDPARWQPTNPVDRERRPGGPVRLLSTMRLARRKRPVPLLRLVGDAHERSLTAGGDGVELTIVGDGPLRPAVERHARHTAAPVVLTGRIDRAAIRDLVAAHDVYVAPARLESFGIAALEARCGGLPVLAQSASGIRHFVTDGVDGFLTADDGALADRIVQLTRDPGLLATLLANARATVPAIDWSTTLDGYEQLYAGVGAEHPVSAP